ncbi:ribonuclease P protein component [Candidatus Uhrbacteria bacterium]|nr:ribonuclease P protein component [Candidatus Uhrbacteria bacterium]
MFERKARLKTRAAAFVGRRGKSVFSPNLRVKWLPARDKITRATVVVPLAFDKRSTRRNRVKRQIREILRPLLASLLYPTELMVFVSRGAAGKKFTELKSELEELLRKARLIG